MRIGEYLGGRMDSIVINGGKRLVGEIKISGSKNASLPIMCASLLTSDPLELHRVPQLTDIDTMKNLLRNHGAEITELDSYDDHSIIISSNKIKNLTAPYDIVRKMRASIWVLGPLLARFGNAKVSMPGGCAIGARQVDLHIASMEALGAEIQIKDGYIFAKSNGRLKGAHFAFSKQSVGATINAILAATMAEGESLFINCAIEPEITDLCKCLITMGAEIHGVGTSEIRVCGKKSLHGAKYTVMSDRIEAGTYMMAAAITKGDIKLTNINYDIVENVAQRMIEAGSIVEYGSDFVRVSHAGVIKPVNISTQPYPGFATDLQAQFMSFMAISDGVSVIAENIFENRFMHVPELCRMGANIIINGKSAIVHGVKRLTGAEVMASDLRASVSLVLSGLSAEGKTKIKRVYHLDRGYYSLENKLRNCGADIARLHGDKV